MSGGMDCCFSCGHEGNRCTCKRAEREAAEARPRPPLSNCPVHAAHCCAVHGCKYGNEDTCPVVLGFVLRDENSGWCQEPYLVNDPAKCRRPGERMPMKTTNDITDKQRELAEFWLTRRVRQIESELETPDMEALARKGVRFSDRAAVVREHEKLVEARKVELTAMRTALEIVKAFLPDDGEE